MPAGNDRSRRFQLWGWLLFVVCSFFFIADGVLAGSPIGIIGSVIFLISCVVFLFSLVQKQA